MIALPRVRACVRVCPASSVYCESGRGCFPSTVTGRAASSSLTAALVSSPAASSAAPGPACTATSPAAGERKPGATPQKWVLDAGPPTAAACHRRTTHDAATPTRPVTPFHVHSVLDKLLYRVGSRGVTRLTSPSAAAYFYVIMHVT